MLVRSSAVVLALACLAALPSAPAVAAPGDRDPGFNGGDRLSIFPPVFPPATSTRGPANDVVIDGSGRTLVVGSSNQVQNNSTIERNGWIARLTPAGTIDTSFGVSGFVAARGYAGASQLVSEGVGFDGSRRLHAAFSAPGGVGVAARYTANGTFDGDYGSGGVASVEPQASGFWQVEAAAVGPDGSTFFVVLDVTSQPSTRTMWLLRLDPNGNPDSAYEAAGPFTVPVESSNGGPPPPVLAAVDSQGRLLVGRSVRVGSPPLTRGEVRRFTPSGVPDSTWGNAGRVVLGHPQHPAVYDDGLLIDLEPTAGDEVLVSVVGYSNYIARLTSSGTIAPGFGAPVIPSNPDTILVTAQDDGKVLAAERTGTDLILRRYTTAGQPDPEFSGDGIATDPNFPQFPAELAVTSDGRLSIVGGYDPAYAARYLVKDPALAPDLVTAPRATGVPSPGRPLQCEPATWTTSPSVEVFWDRAPRSTASDDDPAWTQLPVLGRDYTPTDADLGSRIRCRERATNSNGSSDAPSNSLRVDVGPPALLRAPAISGIPVKGRTLRCDPGEWSGGPDLSASWLRGGAVIPNVQTLTYRLAEEDRRHRIACEITAANDVGSAPPARSTNDLLAVGAPPAARSNPSIQLARTGSRPTDVRLTCGTGTWDEDYGQYDYRWLRASAEIAGATGSTYDAAAADLGQDLRCVVFSTNPAGRSEGASSDELLVPLPATGEPGAIYTGGGFNRLDPLNLLAVTRAWQDKMTELTVARRRATAEAVRTDCSTGQYRDARLPDFARLTAGAKGVYMSARDTCGVLLRAPADQIAYPMSTGIYWAGNGGCQIPNGGGGAGKPCPTLRVTVPRLNAASPPESISALEQAELLQVKPVRVLWDFNRDGRTDASCDPDAPILRTLPSPGNYNIRAVIVSADSEKTGEYSVTDLRYPFHPGSAIHPGALRDAQPFACKTTLIPPEEAAQPCISEVSVGRTHLAGNICPVSARRIPERDLGGLPPTVRQMLEAQALGRSLERAAAPRTTLKTDVSVGQRAAPGSLAYTTTRQVDALSSIGNAAPASIPKEWSTKLRRSVPSFDLAAGQFAMDQIYLVRGPAKLNGIDLDPQDGAVTVMVPSDAGKAIDAIKKMTISNRSASLALGGVPIGVTAPLATDLPDKLGGSPPTLRAANLDALRASLLKKLDLGPFRLAGDAKLRLADDGTAFIDAMAELKGPFKAGSGPIRTKVTVRATRVGTLSLEGVHLQVPKALLGAVTVSGLSLDYDSGGLSIKGQLLFPPLNQGIAINRFRTTADGDFRELDVSYLAGAGQGINIGPGIYLVKLGGGLSLKPDEIRGRAAVSFGPSPGGGCPTAGVDADLNVHFGRPPPFFVDARSTVQLVCIPIGNARFYADATGVVEVESSVSLDLGPIYANAVLRGRMQLPNWQIDMRGRGGIRKLFEGEVKALLSNLGLAGCGRVEVFPATPFTDSITIAGGAGVRFSGGRPPFTYAELLANLKLFTGCSLTSWSPFGRTARAAQADGTRSFTLGPNAPRVVVLEVTGAGGAPRVQVVTPRGETLDASEFGEQLVRGPNLSGLLDSASSRAVLFVRGAPGKWTIKPVDGAPPITSLRHATVLPEPRIDARVGGIGASRMLRFRVKRIPGQTVRFVERSRRGMRQIKTVRGGGSGTASFVTSEGPGTARTIVAEIAQDRIPRESITVARFSAPAPRPARARATARRRGSAVTLRWRRDMFTHRYELTVATGRGRRFVLEPKPGALAARVGGLAKGEGATIRIVGITPAGRRGPVRVVRVRGSMKASSAPKTTRWGRSRARGRKQSGVARRGPDGRRGRPKRLS